VKSPEEKQIEALQEELRVLKTTSADLLRLLQEAHFQERQKGIPAGHQIRLWTQIHETTRKLQDLTQ